MSIEGNGKMIVHGRRSYRRTFNDDPAKLQEMLQRYVAGEGLSVLATAYKCHHASILFQVRKHGVYVAGRLSPQRRKLKIVAVPEIVKKRVRKEKVLPLWSYSFKRMRCCGSKSNRRHLESCVHYKAPVIQTDYTKSEPVNQGKTYAEYVQQDTRKNMMRGFRCAPKVAAYGIPQVKKNTEVADYFQNASSSMSTDFDIPASIVEASTEEQSQDPEPVLL